MEILHAYRHLRPSYVPYFAVALLLRIMRAIVFVELVAFKTYEQRCLANTHISYQYDLVWSGLQQIGTRCHCRLRHFLYQKLKRLTKWFAHVIFGGALSNVLAMEVAAQVTAQPRPTDVDENEDESENVSYQENNEDEEEVASELVSWSRCMSIQIYSFRILE